MEPEIEVCGVASAHGMDAFSAIQESSISYQRMKGVSVTQGTI